MPEKKRPQFPPNPYLGFLLAQARPQVIYSKDLRTQQELRIFDKQTRPDGTTYYPEKEIETLVKGLFPRHLWPQMIDFCRQFYFDFYNDTQIAIPLIVERLSNMQWRISEDYLLFFQGFLKDAAALGFPSVLQPFSRIREKGILELTERSTLDFRNILADKVYVARLILQIKNLRMKELSSLVHKHTQIDPFRSWSTYVSNLSSIPALLSYTPSINEGRVFLNPPVYRFSKGSDLATYGRQEETIYIPDIEQAENLVWVCKWLDMKSFSDNNTTHKIIGGMTLEQAKKIIPDLFGRQAKVTPKRRKKIELGFGMPYEKVKALFETEFLHDTQSEKKKTFWQKIQRIRTIFN